MSLAYNTRFKVSKSYNSFLWENGNTALETIGHFHAYKLLELIFILHIQSGIFVKLFAGVNIKKPYIWTNST